MKVSDDTLHKRDQNGLYSRAKRGEINNVWGMDLIPELPKKPDIVLENEGHHSIDDLVGQILNHPSSRAVMGT